MWYWGVRSCSQGGATFTDGLYEVRFHFGRFFSSKLSLWCFYGLTFAMILDYYVHGDICVKCCRQVKMDSSVESVPRNGFSGSGLPLGR